MDPCAAPSHGRMARHPKESTLINLTERESAEEVMLCFLVVCLSTLPALPLSTKASVHLVLVSSFFPSICSYTTSPFPLNNSKVWET